ncbi:MAG: VOC family protein [Candidatus Sedimenticola sp. 20ELBAFRAG]
MNKQSKIDHIVIGASSLAEGVSYVKSMLGVDIPYGGEHIKLGTHNHLMQLGNETFLEVIAVNQQITSPARPRWYGLDDPYTRLCLERQPSLLTWVVNTGDINGLIQKATFSLGKSELISRGNLSWYFGLPEDGRLLGGGLLPYAIEWHTENHPSKSMTDLGCSIQSVEIFHPYPNWIKSALKSIDALSLVKINELAENETPYLSVKIGTPTGEVNLQSEHSA